MHEAIKELYKICDLERTGEIVGWRRRRSEIDAWVKKWICDIKSEQSITDTKYFATKYNDFLTERLINNMMEDLVEKTAKRDIGKRKISVELTFLRKTGNL